MLRAESEFLLSSAAATEGYRLEERLVAMRVPDDSPLVDKTLVESRLGDAFGLGVMGIVRERSITKRRRTRPSWNRSTWAWWKRCSRPVPRWRV
ncbi:MAG: TrkA C-terminal domain-containing protein [Anaerolineales bacterium]|nr:MAG: TrkA C-terminal domain-containing protein [Anaerolineales bacterium]